MAARSVLAMAAGLAAAAAVWWTTPAPPPPAPPAGAADLAADLDAQLRETSAALHSRALTLSQLPRLAAAVATDATTVADLTQEELSFRLQPGETFELAQLAGDELISLLQMPAGTPPSPLAGRFGRHLVARDGALVVAETIEVTPIQDADRLSGAVLVTRRLELADLGSRFDALGAAAHLDVGGDRVPLGTGTIDRDARVAELPLSGAPVTAQIVVEAAAAPGRSPARIAAALALALAGLVGAILLRRRRPGGAVSDGAVSSGGPDAAPAEAGLSQTPPAGPAPTGSTPYPTASGSTPPQMAAPVAAPGVQFGRYQLVRLLGSGGMADVYLARATGEAGFQKPVALKVLQPHLARRPEVVAYFLDEARLASRLSHPAIVQIFDLGRAGDGYYIAMELIDGADLDRVLRAVRAGGRAVPVAIALHLLRKVCDGLHAAHTAVDDQGQPLGLIHRDVKCGNVMVSRDGVVKVTDFGIAKANEQLHVTAVGSASGTPAVMAPEQRMGGAMDQRVDVYGVGAIAYELLANVAVNLDVAALIPQGVQAWPPLPPPSQVRPGLPAELDDLVMQALSFDAAGRPDSCAVVEHLLEAVATGQGLVASDKDVVRWLADELSQLPSVDGGETAGDAVA